MTGERPAQLGPKGRARRAQIIDVASGLFGQRGYDQVSLREIASEAGITHPLLVHYFRTKEELLRAVMESWRERALALGVVGHDETGDRPARMVELARRNAEAAGYISLFVHLSAAGVEPEHPAHGLFVEQYSAVHGSLLEYFTQQRDAGRLRPGVDPDTAARSVIALQDGAQLQWLYFPEVDVPMLVRAYLELVLVEPFGAAVAPQG